VTQRSPSRPGFDRSIFSRFAYVGASAKRAGTAESAMEMWIYLNGQIDVVSFC